MKLRKIQGENNDSACYWIILREKQGTNNYPTSYCMILKEKQGANNSCSLLLDDIEREARSKQLLLLVIR